jgi:hypothetical protein
MSRLIRITVATVAAILVAWLWYTAWPGLFRAGMPSITEDADFALLVRLTGFVVIIAISFYFALKNLLRNRPKAKHR